MLGYYCAYYRYYYPYEFVTAYLNNSADDKDIASGTALAHDYGLSLSAPRYGISRDVYTLNKESKIIAKGVASIKNLNAQESIELYELSQSLETEYFVDVLFMSIHFTSIGMSKIKILIKVSYFEQFGNCAELLRIAEWFEKLKLGTAKTVSKSKAQATTGFEQILRNYASNTNAKGKVLQTYTITDMLGLLHAIEDQIKSLKIPEWSYKLKATAQNEYLGYVDLTTGKEEDRRKLYVLDIFALGDKFKGGVWKYKIKTRSIGSGKTASLDIAPNTFKSRPFKKGDIIYVSKLAKDNKGYWQLFSYQLLI